MHIPKPMSKQCLHLAVSFHWALKAAALFLFPYSYTNSLNLLTDLTSLPRQIWALVPSIKYTVD